MTKEEMIELMANDADLTKKQATLALESFMSGITKQLKAGKKISFSGFGAFSISERKARVVRNPHTGAAIQIPATKVPVFRAGKRLKEAVRK